MSFLTELFLAWRYFKPKRSAVSVITLISVIGVALGVSVLIVVIAVMTGFTDHLKSKLLETGAHGQIQKGLAKSDLHPDGVTPYFIQSEASELIAMLQTKGAKNAAAVLKSPVLNGRVKAACPSTRCVLTSTMASLKLTRRMASSA